MSEAESSMRIGIIGGGLMGLSLAQKLTQYGHETIVFEHAKQLGGLTTYQSYGKFYWDRFYHVILPSDQYLIEYLKNIGLGDELCWCNTKTGYYVDKQTYGLSNNIEFLKFPLLTLWSKIRLAIGIIYCTRIKDWNKLESITVEAWLKKYTGNEAFHKFWKPLLLAKLGENYKRVSAVFIWSYITRLFSARDPSLGKEQLGHVKGGYKTVFDQLAHLVKHKGGTILTETSVSRVFESKNGLMVSFNSCDSPQEDWAFDKVIFTAPTPFIKNIIDDDLVAIKNTEQEVEYLGVVCMVTVSKKPITNYYVTNIADDEIPFTGVIGMSSVVDESETNGEYLTYFPKYLHSDDSFFSKSDNEIEAIFMNGFRKMFPAYSIDDINCVFINRAQRTQPLQTLNYSSFSPSVKTRHEDLLILNTSQFTNNTLNNNEVMRSVKDFLFNNFAIN